MLFAEKLKQLRDAKGWSQKELADRSGTTQQAVARWEMGERIPGFDHVQAMCKALDVPCTVFDGVEHAEIDEKRARGRPPKASDAPVTGKPTKGKPKKGKG